MVKLTPLFIILFFISCTPVRTAKEQIFPHSSLAHPSRRNGTYYFIKKGDSLWKISKKYNISIRKIVKENKISTAQNLRIGQKIFIPCSYPIKSSFSFFWPLTGEIINFFGEKVDSSINNGINIKANPGNKNVKASAKGKVVFSSCLKGWGKTIVLKHGSNFYTVYANLENTLVKEPDFAAKGQTIGKIASGKNGNHILHFEIRKKYIPQDPLRYLN